MLLTLVPDRAPVVAGCTARVIKTLIELNELREPWKALFDRSPAAAAPLRFEWVRHWWDIYGPVYGAGPNSLRVLAFERDGKLIGILPLYEFRRGIGPLAVRQLRFITTGAAEFEETSAEYLNLLHAPGEEKTCVQALATLLKSHAIKWDELQLQDMPAESPLMELRELLGGRGRKINVIDRGVTYIADASGGMEGYLATMSKTTLRKARKILKEIASPDFKFQVAQTSEQAGKFFDEMVELHRKRWEAEGHRGSFAPRHALFHRSLAVELTPSGVTFLSRLTLKGATLALLYGYRVGSRYEGYQMGIDHNASELKNTSVRSAGAAAHMALMEHLLQCGVVHCDFLAGHSRFKQDYARSKRPLASLAVASPNMRGMILGVIFIAARALRRLFRSAPKSATTVVTQDSKNAEDREAS